MSKLEQYKSAEAALPEQFTAWQIFGAGMENVGKDGEPSTLDLRPPKSNEVLLRVDALGICLSDIKIIAQGSSHARLRGRDLATDPTVLGHECSATVVAAGDQWKDQFTPGQRYIVQADIYYKGEGVAFGYMLPGGMQQYTYVDERVLDGDEGCYLLPVQAETGYSQAALAEPWACVEMSYNLVERLAPGKGDILIVSADPAAWSTKYPGATRVAPDALPEEGATYDDIILDGPSVAVLNALAGRLNKDGILYLVGKPVDDGAVSLDVGAIHYQGRRYYGGADTLEAIADIHKRYDLLPGGAALFVGAGGPMGQMHVQRAVELQNGPALVVATDLDRGRLDHIERRFGDIAKAKGQRLVTLSPSDFADEAAMNAHIAGMAPEGYSDIAIMAPVARLAAGYLQFAADNAFINVFAGVGIGSCADFKLSDLCRGIKLVGSSGSRISDLRKVLEMVEAGELNTNLSVAAIGGLSAARDGLQAVKDAKFPGKTVLYTQIPDLPLTPLEDVPDQLPYLKDLLTTDGAWTKEAEAALLERYV